MRLALGLVAGLSLAAVAVELEESPHRRKHRSIKPAGSKKNRLSELDFLEDGDDLEAVSHDSVAPGTGLQVRPPPAEERVYPSLHSRPTPTPPSPLRRCL